MNGEEKTISGLKDSLSFYRLEVPAGASNLKIAISDGTGDADLYVKYAQAPTLDSYDCRPWVGGNTESCDINPATAGVYHVMISGYRDYHDVVLLASYDVATEGQLQNGVAEIISNTQNVQLHRSITIPAGASNLQFDIRGGSGDADLYVRFAEPATLNDYDCRPWKNGSTESCHINPVQNGTYHVLVNAYRNYENVELVVNYDNN